MDYEKALVKIFNENPDRRVAHELSLPVLKQLAGDKNYLFRIIRENLSDPAFLNARRDYSKLLKFYVSCEKEFTLVINIFPPNPFNNSKLSVKSIHHHQNLLLTTITFLGAGYDSILFKKNFSIDKDKHVSLKVDRYFTQGPGESTFIDSRVPHVVFFPDEVTATYSLWSMNKRRKLEKLEKLPFLHRIKSKAARIASFFSISDQIGLNDVSEVYFYIRKNKISVITHPVKYSSGDSEAHLYNLLCFMNSIGFDDLDFLRSLTATTSLPEATSRMLQAYIQNPGSFNSFRKIHEFIPEENMSLEKILDTVSAAEPAE